MTSIAFRASHTRALQGLLTVFLVFAVFACSSADQAATDQPPAESNSESRVARGEYLVTIAGCVDCHTPLTMTDSGPVPDMARMLSGHPENFPVTAAASLPEPWLWAGTGTNTAFSGPWGVSFATNLTPDEDTGIGAWPEDWFIASIRTGKHWGRGRDIMPPMPWQAYSQMTDEDLKAIFAYLQSIPALKNNVPQWIPPAEGDH